MKHWAKWKCMTCGKINTTHKMGMNYCKCMDSAVDLSRYFNGTRYLDAENLGHSELSVNSFEKVKKQYLDAMMNDAKDITLKTIMYPGTEEEYKEELNQQNIKFNLLRNAKQDD